jgi:hypothetical protein
METIITNENGTIQNEVVPTRAIINGNISIKKKYMTMSGMPVTILTTTKSGIAPIVGLVRHPNDTEELMCWLPNGKPIFENLNISDTLMEIIEENSIEVFQLDELVMFQYSKYNPFKPAFYRRYNPKYSSYRQSSDAYKLSGHFVYGYNNSSWGRPQEVEAYAVRKPTQAEIDKYLPANSLLRRLLD